MIETTQHQDIVVRLSLIFNVTVNVSLLIDGDIIDTGVNSDSFGFSRLVEGIAAGEHTFTYVVTPDIAPIKEDFDVLKYNQLTLYPNIANANVELLASELSSLANGVNHNGVYIVKAMPNADVAAIQAVVDAHNPIVFTDSQQLSEDNQITKSQIKEYLRAQLLSANPDPATIKATIQSAVGANVNVSQAIDNMATLKGYDTSSNLGYIAGCIDLVSILL